MYDEKKICRIEMNLVGLFKAELKATAEAEEVSERQFVILLWVNCLLGIMKII